MDTPEFEFAVSGCSNCTICKELIDKLNELYFSKCLMPFHRECIEIWYVKNDVCPICKDSNYDHNLL